jgi:hypothetical protein
MTIPNTKTLNQIVNILNKISYWAFVYTESNLSKHNYRLYGYIILRHPENQNWFETCLCKDCTCINTYENPNKYRKRGLQTTHDFADELDAVVRIDRGSYKAGAGLNLNNHI